MTPATAVLDTSPGEVPKIEQAEVTALNTVRLPGTTTPVVLPAVSAVSTGTAIVVTPHQGAPFILGSTSAPLFVDSGAAAAAGWSVVDLLAWRDGQILQFRLIVQRTGGTITVPASGDLGNQAVATLPVSLRGSLPAALVCGGGGATGRLVGGSFVPSTGVVSITSIAGAANVVNGNQMTFGGMFLLSA